MRLIQAKVRCVEGVRDSGWFVPGRESTLILSPVGKDIGYLFEALQALNPPYLIGEQKPFRSHPKTWRQGPHGRKVIPEKKTAVIMVFSAVPELVRELSEFDESLFETDRIEVGRRLDYSRWVTFVEISASGRWSDVKDDFLQLRALVKSPDDLRQSAFFDDLLETDRLKGALAEKCRNWLNWLQDNVADLAGDQLGAYKRCLQVVNQAERFNRARRHVETWLPPTLAVRSGLLRDGSGLWNFDAPKGPAGCMLQKLNNDRDRNSEEWQLGLRESMAENMKLLNAEKAFMDLPERPELIVEEGQLHIAGLEAESRLRSLQKYLYLTCLLSLQIYQKKPLLLLDFSGCELDQYENEIPLLVRWLMQLGRSCQVIVGADSEIMTGEQGWQSVLRAGAGGLEESMLIND